jgi:hypothetical protein
MKSPAPYSWQENLKDLNKKYDNKVLQNDYCQLIVLSHDNHTIDFQYK